MNLIEYSPFFAVIVTLLGILFVNWFNRRKLHADLISKARIDWIQDVRNVSSQYLYEIIKASNYGKRIANKKVQILIVENSIEYEQMISQEMDEDTYKIISNEVVDVPLNTYDYKIKQEQILKLKKEIKDLYKEYNHQIDKVLEKNILLRIYFTDRVQKDNFLNKIKYFKYKIFIKLPILKTGVKSDLDKHLIIKSKMLYLSQKLNKALANPDVKKFDEISKDILILTNTISDYLKEEWDKAKRKK
ncbi:hypothetical protein [Mammaliicoccus sciuri]|uniref:hypothetical protein n=1 Tax=Mammaliicoccus sciuri TaxID=1296 RepID=UPI0036E55157